MACAGTKPNARARSSRARRLCRASVAARRARCAWATWRIQSQVRSSTPPAASSNSPFAVMSCGGVSASGSGASTGRVCARSNMRSGGRGATGSSSGAMSTGAGAAWSTGGSQRAMSTTSAVGTPRVRSATRLRLDRSVRAARRSDRSAARSASGPTCARNACSRAWLSRATALSSGSHSTARTSRISSPTGPPSVCMRQNCTTFGRPPAS